MKAIFCAGEQGRTVLDILRRAGGAEDVAFFDDDEGIQGSTVVGKRVVGGMESLSEFDSDDTQFVVAFGDRQGVRLEIADEIAERGFDFYSIVDPDATVSSTASVGHGSIVNAQTYVGPDVRLNEHVLVDSAVNVSHDSVLERGATVAPNATLVGGTRVGVDAYVGAGATVLEDVTIGEGAVVGAGAVVNRDVAPRTTVVGVPAEPL